MPRYLGIDYGLERTGTAISDPAGKLAFPFGLFCLSDYPSRKKLLDDLSIRAKGACVDAIVMGLPLYPDGNENIMCRRIRNFAERLQRRLALPVYFVNEIYTSSQAKDFLAEAGVKKKVARSVIDQQAACIILQSFLDSRTGVNSA